ncbi:MAG: hypothetical protein GY913_14065 [Proteobacteria bacterium]|nr:hypothetical protein [Pseudomonadota bacterium]
MRSSLVVLVLLMLVAGLAMWLQPDGLMLPSVSYGSLADRGDYDCVLEVDRAGAIPPVPSDCALLVRVDGRAPADTVARLKYAARSVGQSRIDLEVVARMEPPAESKSGPAMHRLEPGARAVEAVRVLIVPPQEGEHAQVAAAWSELLELGVRDIAVELGAGEGRSASLAAPTDEIRVHRLTSPELIPLPGVL